jgi:hypothetical protein
VLHLAHAREFFTDLPFRPFPVSWQDTGSGGTTLALTALALAYGPLRRRPAPAAATLAAATGAAAHPPCARYSFPPAGRGGGLGVLL